jgi:hypothetical protein
MGQQGDGHAAKDERSSEKIAPGKRPYQAPRLVTYGNLRDISLGNKGGNKNDGDTGLARTHR